MSIFMYQIYGSTETPRAMSSVDYQGSKTKSQGLKRFIHFTLRATEECSSTEMDHDSANDGTSEVAFNRNYRAAKNNMWGTDKHFYAFSSELYSRRILAV
jgi:hypothetical protein